MNLRAAVRAIALVAALVLVIWGVSNISRAMDQVTVWQYEPSATIAEYAEATTMTDEGVFLFYASRPVLAPASEFDANCGIEQSISAIGCYRPDFRTIFLFDLGPGFESVEQVTAAHELLHAVWDRMSETDRAAIGPLLEAEAALRVDDADFTGLMDLYAEIEPGQRLNELHSIVATDFATISGELEAHYAQYFADRSAIVALGGAVLSL